MAHAGAYVEAIVVIGVCALGLPVVLVVIRAILTLAIAVDIAIHALTHGAVDIAVGVVCLTIYELWVVVAQFACPDAEHITLVGLVLCFCLSIPFVKESRFHLYVEHMVFLSVIVARMACQLRLTVVELQLACYFCRQLTYYLTAAEHVLAVHHQAYGFVIPEEFAVTVLHSRQFLYQFGKACSFLQFESLGVKHNGVAHHSDARHLGCHFNFLQHECRGLQLDNAKVGSIFHLAAIGIVHLTEVLVAYHAELEHYASLHIAIQVEASRTVSLCRSHTRPSRLWVDLAFYACSDKNLAGLGIYYLSLERVGAAFCRLHDA